MSKLVKVAGWTGRTRVNVVFVHGLGGHAYDTWGKCAESNDFWPVWLAHDIPGLASWTLAYEAPPTNWLGTAMPIQDRAKNLLEQLLGQRELANIPLVFVCHSLGGLVVKQILRAADGRRAYDDTEAEAFINSVKGIVFIATPHTGSVQATLLDKLRLVAWPSASTVDLIKNNANLRDLNIWYRNWSGAIRHKVFYEKQGTAAGLVVEDDSSDPGLLHVDPVGIDADHLTICKPRNVSDLVYTRTRDFVVDEILDEGDLIDDCGTLLKCDLPKVPHTGSSQAAAIALRLAFLLVVGFLTFAGLKAIFFPADALGQATTDQIVGALRVRKPALTTEQIDQAVRALTELRNDPSFEQAVAAAKTGNMRVAEGLWRQIYENREKAQQREKAEQAEAARRLAASLVTYDVAHGLDWYRKATALDSNDMTGWLGLGDAAVIGGTCEESAYAFEKYASLARVANNEQGVAVGWIRIGDVLVRQDNLSAALQRYNDSQAVLARLTKGDPANTELKRKLAVSYVKVGQVLNKQGNPSGALSNYKVSQEILERLAKADPGNAEWQRNVAAIHLEIAALLVQQGNVRGVLDSYRECKETFDRLTKKDPSNVGWQNDLSVAQDNIGDLLLGQNDLQGALDSYMASLAIRDRFAGMDSANAEWQRNRAVSYGRIGDVLLQKGDLDGALDTYKKSQAIFKRLAEADPSNSGLQNDTSISQYSIGDVLFKQSDLQGALDSYKAAQASFDRLSKADPSNVQWQANVSKAGAKIGDVLVEKGDLQGALDTYRESKNILERLSKGDLSNLGLQSDLALVHIKIADVLFQYGDLQGALDGYNIAQAGLDRLGKAYPENVDIKHNLFATNNKMGRLLTRQGNLPAALASYKASEAICDFLAEASPQNVERQRDHALSHGHVASIELLLDHHDDGLKALMEGQQIIARLLVQAPEDARLKEDLAWFDRAIAEAK